MTITSEEISTENLKLSIDPITLEFNCDYDEHLPCSINQFI